MSTGARIAARYRGYTTAQLRQFRSLMRNPRRQAAVDIVLTERQEAYQRGFDAGQVLLDAVSGEHAKTLHGRALETAMREVDASRYQEAEQAMGVADALWDYLRERSDV